MDNLHFFKSVVRSDSITESLEHLQRFSKYLLGSEQICIFLFDKRRGVEHMDSYTRNIPANKLSGLIKASRKTNLFYAVPEGSDVITAIPAQTAGIEYGALFAFRLQCDGYVGTLAFCFDERTQPSEDALGVCNLIRLHMEHLIDKIHFRKQLHHYTKYEGLFNMLKIKDEFTFDHSYNVAFYASLLASRIGLPAPAIEQIKIASLLHDIGKIMIPDNILLKPSPLSEDEKQFVKRHPLLGCKLLKAFPDSDAAMPVVRWHHERMDGRGYPDGLQADEIPLQVRIVTIADAFDAMTSNRVYRPSLRIDEVKEQMRQNAGTQFDPVLVDEFLKALTDQSKLRLLQQ